MDTLGPIPVPHDPIHVHILTKCELGLGKCYLQLVLPISIFKYDISQPLSDINLDQIDRIFNSNGVYKVIQSMYIHKSKL